jgi:hypothetical protein
MSSQAAAIGWSNRKGTFNRSEKRLALFAEGDAALSFDLLLLPSEERTVAVSLDPAAIELLFIHANARATVARGAPGGSDNEIHRLSVPGSPPSAGTVELNYAGGFTGAIDWDATAADVQAAYEAASWAAPGDISATGGPLPGTPVDVEFTGAFAGIDAPNWAGSGDTYEESWAMSGGDPLDVAILQEAGGGGPGLDDTTAIEPNWPVVWWPTAPHACPFTAAITQLTFNNLSATRRTLVRFRAILGALA